MKGQAIKGGQLGVNGEFYKGGQFLPSNSKTIKGSVKSSSQVKKSKRVLIEPGVFEYSDSPSIFNRVKEFVEFENSKMVRKFSIENSTLEYFGLLTDLDKLIVNYNNGDRYLK